MTIEACVHLQPIVDALAAAGIDLGRIESPYTDDNVWWACDCTFDADALRARLKLDDLVSYIEYDGRVAGSDATFSCKAPAHKVVIMGVHPSYAPKGTPRLG